MKKHTEETKRKISIRQSLNNKGGRSKWYSFLHPSGMDIKVQGTWELRFAKIISKIDKNWIKPSLYHKEHSFKWLDINGITHTYTPDFYSPVLKKYYEIKGYWWGDDENKMKRVLEQNNINIEIIRKNRLLWYKKKYL